MVLQQMVQTSSKVIQHSIICSRFPSLDFKYAKILLECPLFRPFLRDSVFDCLELFEQLLSPVRRRFLVLLLLPARLFRLLGGGAGDVRARLPLPRPRRSRIALTQFFQDRPAKTKDDSANFSTNSNKGSAVLHRLSSAWR